MVHSTKIGKREFPTSDGKKKELYFSLLEYQIFNIVLLTEVSGHFLNHSSNKVLPAYQSLTLRHYNTLILFSHSIVDLLIAWDYYQLHESVSVRQFGVHHFCCKKKYYLQVEEIQIIEYLLSLLFISAQMLISV